MYFKFRILKYANNIAPEDFDPSVEPPVVDMNTIGLRIEIDDEELLVANAGSLTTGTTADVTIGGIDCHFSIADDDYYVVQIEEPEVTEQHKVRIRITHESSRTYDESFYVYGYDLGLNPNDTIESGWESTVSAIDFKLVPNVFTVPSTVTANVVGTSTINYRSRDGANDLTFVKVSSGYGTIEYKAPSGTVLAAGNTAVIPNPVGPTGTPTTVVTVVTTNGVVTEDDVTITPPVTTVPDIGYAFTDSSCEECGCISPGGEVTFTIDGSGITPYLQDLDPKAHQLGNVLYALSLKDMTDGGAEVDSETNAVTLNPDTPIGVLTYVYELPPELSWDRYYQLVFKIYTPDVNGTLLVTKTVDIIPCSFLEFERTGCGQVTWTNKNIDGQILKVYQLDSAGTETLVSSHTNNDSGDTVELELEDGVYLLKVYDAEETLQYQYKYLAMCTITNCLVEYTKALACSDPCSPPTISGCGCDGEESTVQPYDLAAFGLMVFTYLNLLNSIYNTSYITTVVSESDLQNFKDLALLQERLLRYCEGCQ